MSINVPRRVALFLGAALCLVVGLLALPQSVQAQDCSQYGFAAQPDYLSGGCKCMSGYVFRRDFLGDMKCASADSVCSDKFGYGATYDSLTERCQCGSGKVFVRARGGGLVCASCTDIHGMYAEYDYLSKSCRCQSGYTAGDDGVCRERQNNVYVWLDELAASKGVAVVRDATSGQKYLVALAADCPTSTLALYAGRQVVANLGTDFVLHAGDFLVLHLHSTVCGVSEVAAVDRGFSLSDALGARSTPPSSAAHQLPAPVRRSQPTLKRTREEVCRAAKDACESECSGKTIETWEGLVLTNTDFRTKCESACDDGKDECEDEDDPDDWGDEFEDDCRSSCPGGVYDWEKAEDYDDTNARRLCERACEAGKSAIR